MGSMALWRLAGRAADVLGFEQFAPGHDRGSSHGESRGIRTAHWEGARETPYVGLNQRAFELWRELEGESHTDILNMNGYLTIGYADSQIVSGTVASSEFYGLEHEVLGQAEMRERYPQHRMSADEVAVHETQAGVLFPETGIRAAVQRAEALGARIVRNTAVSTLTCDPAGVTLVADGDEVRARHAIVSVGAWLPAFLPELGGLLQIERQVQFWFEVNQPDIFTPERCPVFIRELSGRRIRYGFPTLDGKTIKAACHHGGKTTSAREIDRQVHPEDLAPVQEFVQSCLNGVGNAVARTKVCMYTNTPDHHFLVGSIPGRPNVTVLGGFSGHGYRFGPVFGDTAADLALEGKTGYPIEYYSFSRFNAASHS
jgi:sarcosine oxidase